jgi:hypothetical protein
MIALGDQVWARKKENQAVVGTALECLNSSRTNSFQLSYLSGSIEAIKEYSHWRLFFPNKHLILTVVVERAMVGDLSSITYSSRTKGSLKEQEITGETSQRNFLNCVVEPGMARTRHTAIARSLELISRIIAGTLLSQIQSNLHPSLTLGR